MDASSPAPPPFLGQHEVPMDTAWRWSIGPLRLDVERRADAWGIGVHRVGTPVDPAASVEPIEPRAPAEPSGPTSAREAGSDDAETYRIPTTGGPGVVEVQVRTADRPLVAKPIDAVTVPPGASCTVFVSSPVWIRVLLDGREALELPTWRPRKCRYGENTLRGVHGYETQTRLSLSRATITNAPGRAITVGRIDNESDAPVTLDRFAVPLPSMALFLGAEARIWTTSVEVRCKTGETPSTRVAGAPAEAGTTTRIADPRATAEGDGLASAFNAIWRRGTPWG